MMSFIMAALGGIGIFELLLIVIVFAVPLILFIIAIMDLIKRDFNDSSVKIIWALVIVFMPFLGSIIYLVAGRK